MESLQDRLNLRHPRGRAGALIAVLVGGPALILGLFKFRIPLLTFIINIFGYQLGWFCGGLLLRRLSSNSHTNGPLYGVLYLLVPSMGLILSRFPRLAHWGTGKAISGFANVGVWLLMEHMLEQRVRPRLWARYFSFYLVFYHLGGLITQAYLGSAIFHYRHTSASMAAFLGFSTIFPQLMLWTTEPESSCTVPERDLAVKTHAFSFKQRLVTHPYFEPGTIALAGVLLSILSAAYPIYFRIALHRAQDKIESLVRLPLPVALICLLTGGILSGLSRKYYIRCFPPLKQLQHQLLIMFLGTLGCLFSKGTLGMGISMVALGAACHNLYPALVTRIYQWGDDKTPLDFKRKLDNCVLYANTIFSILSQLSPLLLPQKSRVYSSLTGGLLYYFLNSYLFLFVLAAFPERADQFVETKKQKMTGWLKEKRILVSEGVKKKLKKS